MEDLALNSLEGWRAAVVRVGRPIAELRAVRKSYRGVPAVRDVSLGVTPGELLALLGPNGAGKSTAIRLLLGLTRPDGGEASLFGVTRIGLPERRRLGVMMQSEALPDTLRVGEILALTRSYYPDPYPLDELVEMVGAAPLLRRFYGSLSGGEKRLVQAGLAFCGRPELIVLDEPTTGLDVEARRRLWGAVRGLRARGAAVILTTHYLEEAEAVADRVVVLNHGQVVAEGSVDEVRGLATRTRLRCVSTLDAEEIRRWPGVERVDREGPHLTIIARSGDQTVRQLLAADDQAGQLEIRASSLEEAFGQLVRDVA